MGTLECVDISWEKQVADFLAARQKPPLQAIKVIWTLTADIQFEVEGELYTGETAALKIMRELRDAFPGIGFDVMVKPAEFVSI